MQCLFGTPHNAIIQKEKNLKMRYEGKVGIYFIDHETLHNTEERKPAVTRQQRIRLAKTTVVVALGAKKRDGT